ncbi:MAG: alginate lyase family protein [Nannocystaceae bacterium]
MLTLFASGSVSAKEITLTSSATAGDPGDTITFEYSVTDDGVKGKAVMIDGKELEWGSSYTWTAISGTHVFYVLVILTSGDPMEEKYIAVEISGNEGGLKHPGIYNSQRELDEIKDNVNGPDDHPMKLGWEQMSNWKSTEKTDNLEYASLAWKPHAVKILNPKIADQKESLLADMRSAYAHALSWVVTGDQAHADKAIEIDNAWGAIYEGMECPDYYKHLYGSWVGHMAVMGAEIIRHYEREGELAGWAEDDIKQYADSVVRDLEVNSLSWEGSRGYYVGHNQPAAIARSRIALGIFLDDRALVDSGLYLLFDKIYDGKEEIKEIHGHYVNLVGLSIAKTGDVMEFNRGGGDAGHGTGTLNALVHAAEILRHQKVASEYEFWVPAFRFRWQLR